MQSVGEYEARYGAYDTRRQEQRPQEPEEDNRDSPRIFRNEQKKPTSTNTRQLPSAEKVKIRKCQKFTPKSRCLSEISADCKCRFYILQFFGDAIFIPAGAPHQVCKVNFILLCFKPKRVKLIKNNEI